MRWTRFGLGLCGLLALAGSWAWSAEPAAPSPVPRLYTQQYCPPGHHVLPPCPTPPAPPPKEAAPPSEQPTVPSDAFAQAPEAGTEAAESFNPTMFGDIIGPSGARLVRLRVPRGSSSTLVSRVIRVPLASRGTFKIADNESPRPLDRVFFNYNYFNNVYGSINGAGIPRADLHSETIGFEKTFLDRNASFGVRLPFLQLNGFDQIEDSQIGDLTFILKYAVINDRATGNVVSGGLAITAPTGEDPVLLEGFDVHSTLIQPWGGFIFNTPLCYAHGFSSLVIPTDSRDVTIWFNDIGFGLWAYRTDAPGSLISAVVPTVELHVNTPLNHRGSTSFPIGFIDSVNVTGGVFFVFNQRIQLGMAVATPLTGPQPFDIEALANLNFRF